jgi:hypothetical protein
MLSKPLSLRTSYRESRTLLISLITWDLPGAADTISGRVFTLVKGIKTRIHLPQNLKTR